MKKAGIIKSLIILIICCISQNSFSQEYVKNIRVIQNDKEVLIFYDLKSNANKAYIDKRKMVKSHRFNIELYYSIDEGETYHIIQNSSGDIGNKISEGNNKKIIWQPAVNNYGYVGNIIFKIIANPIIPKTSIGYSYAILFETFDIPNEFGKKHVVNIYFKVKNGGNLFVPLGYTSGIFNKVWMNRDKHHRQNSFFKLSLSGFMTGIGYQTKNRLFSFHFFGGLGKITWEDEGEIFKDGQFFSGIGLDVKLIDTNYFSTHLSIGVLDGSYGASIFYSGLTLQL